MGGEGKGERREGGKGKGMKDDLCFTFLLGPVPTFVNYALAEGNLAYNKNMVICVCCCRLIHRARLLCTHQVVWSGQFTWVERRVAMYSSPITVSRHPRVRTTACRRATVWPLNMSAAAAAAVASAACTRTATT